MKTDILIFLESQLNIEKAQYAELQKLSNEFSEVKSLDGLFPCVMPLRCCMARILELERQLNELPYILSEKERIAKQDERNENMGRYE